MERLVWDSFTSPVRITFTIMLLLTAAGTALGGEGGWATVPILSAAIVFHIEYRLSIDPNERTYEMRKLVKPFGVPKTGPLDDIEHIRLSMTQGEHGISYGACFVFKAPKYDEPPRFTISSGSMDKVLDDVAKVVKATQIPVQETKELQAARKGFDSLEELLRKNRP